MSDATPAAAGTRAKTTAPVEPLLKPEALADQLQMPVKTLAEWRSGSKGPKFLKVGRHVRYRQSDVDLWLAAQEQSTAS